MNNITENNKLLAKFMNFEPCIVLSDKGKRYDYNIPNNFTLIKEVETTIESNWCEVLEEQDYCFVSDLKFHFSWDWLMPVVEKIENIENVIISIYFQSLNHTTRISIKNKDIVVVHDSNKLNTVYDAIIEFIKWYDKQKI